jgi:4,5-dihydroxyphthalate decarboxylase
MLLCRRDSPIQGPRDLAGRTLGVRAYTQTTGTWLRGILHDQFGVDLGSLRWVTFEPAHVDGYADPPNCRRAPDGSTLLEMTLAGEVDAAGGVDPHPDLRCVVADVEAAEAEFGLAPINHTLVVRSTLDDAFPWLAGELFQTFSEARALEPSEAAEYGVAANRVPLERLARYAFEQGITPRLITPDELFPPC